MKKLFTFSVLVILGLGFSGLHAQEIVAISGGEATGNVGTVSFSIGQIFYTTHTGNDGSVAHGVQQPYEISVLTEVEETEDISLSIVAYPNPTCGLLTLRNDGYQGENISYRIYDISGRFLEAGMLSGDKTNIHMGSKPPALYILKVYDNQKEIKVFRVVKR